MPSGQFPTHHALSVVKSCGRSVKPLKRVANVQTGLERYPEFKPLVDRVVELAVKKINVEARKIESDMPYKAQFTLEEVIRRLKELV